MLLQVELAVPALVKFASQKRGKQLRLLNEHETILLILALKKIPNPDKKPRRMWVLVKYYQVKFEKAVYDPHPDCFTYTASRSSLINRNLLVRCQALIDRILFTSQCLSTVHFRLFSSPLPYSLHSENVEVCLFTKEDSSKVKQLLKSKDVTVKKVWTIIFGREMSL